MSITFRLFSNTSWGILAKIASRLSHAIIAIVISRSLGVNATGAYNIGLTYFTIGLGVAVWGFDQTLILEISKDNSKIFKYFGNLFILQAAFGVFVFIVLYITSLLVPYPEQTRVLVQVLSLSIIPETVTIICQAVFIAFEKFKRISIINLSTSIIKVIAIFLMVYLNNNLIEIVWIFTIISFLSMVVFIYLTYEFLPKPGFKIDWEFCISQLNISAIFFIISVIYTLESRIDILILSFIATDYDVGLYSAALGIVSFFYLLPQAFRDAIFPIISRLHIEKPESAQKLYQLSTKYILLLTMPISAGISVLSSEIILLIYKEPFINASVLLSIVIWIFPIFSIMILNTRLLIVDQKGKYVIKVLFLSPLLLVILNLVFYPIYGIVISSIIRVLAPLVITLGIAWLVAKYLYKPNIQPYIYKISISLLIMSILVFYSKTIGLMISILIGILIYFSALRLLKVFNQKDIFYWRTIFNEFQLSIVKNKT